ncbi:polysaccharide biosynthesis/export family protein [Desulfovibrio sp. 6_1_46AFAA]|uniref:polysaccharide biosynthesis/export family protein n=1 Tax=Desulfovibrio sp. 6_1_46AFAA TaxID=665942 RepID=UPI001E35ED33|nr:polysaccharide biosynthesis/export family protein [Desulfovibrio sp. 6_1_46AFAA]
MHTSAHAAEEPRQNGATYGGSLGKSGNPSPGGSGGIQGIPSTRPPSYQAGGYQRETVHQQGVLRQDSGYRRENRQRQYLPGLPAWALDTYQPDMTQGLQPFGANLFRGNFAGTYGNGMNDDYVILPGDRITVRVWGARSYDDVLFVDQQGNIFLPEVGPVRIAGLRQSELPGAVRAELASVFPENVNIYVNLQSAQPVAVYVAGNVPNPGRYAGGPQDSVMSYLDRAGGILPEQGSYRNIKILRGKQTIGRVDLYSYMLRGELPAIRLKDGDTILVEPFGMSVAAYGLLRQPARYEFRGATAGGRELLAYALPMNGVSHVSVGGMRNDEPFNVYVTLDDFRNLRLEDGDRVEFVADTRGKTIMVAASGAIHGASRFPVLKQTRLKTLLEYVAVEPELADIKSIYIRRRSVAAEQKVILADALRRLEQSALTATSASVDEAGIRVKEAELIQNFVQRASQLEPDGVLVVSREGRISDVLLEEGDEIIIPRKTDVVHVSGEVLIPTAVTWEKGLSLKGYLSGAGGLSDRADAGNILIVGLNGEVSRARGQKIEPGDRILVMPRFDSKNLQLVKDVTQVLYQMAVAVKVAVGL